MNAEDFLGKIIEFNVYTRQRRLILGGHILFRDLMEDIIWVTFKDLIDSITAIHPRLYVKKKIYKKLIMSLDLGLSLIPYQATWLPLLLPSFFDVFGMLLKRLINDLLSYISRDRIFLDSSSSVSHKKEYSQLLLNILASKSSLIYALGLLNRDYILRLLRDYFNGKKVSLKS